jgi:hypothetical protein
MVVILFSLHRFARCVSLYLWLELFSDAQWYNFHTEVQIIGSNYWEVPSERNIWSLQKKFPF